MDRFFRLFAVALIAASPAAAQSWPTRPLTLVVPFAAGGPSDVAGRIIAQRMSEVLGQQVVVENPSGAGGTLGSLRVAKAAPDGYQFVIGNIGTHTWSQSLYKKPPYDTVADFLALSLVVESLRAVITPTNFPASSLPEFITYIKANQSHRQVWLRRGGFRITRELYLAQCCHWRVYNTCAVSWFGTRNARSDSRPGRLYVRFAIDLVATGRS
jgi:tripartite-type tricarboxylate transporter receptor subunit TctC